MKIDDTETLEGTVEGIVFHSDTTDYTVLELSDDRGTLYTAVGALPLPAEGERLMLRGKFVFHPEYGKQFSFDTFEKRLPEGIDEILRYLSSRTVKGVGPVTAKKIVERFGTETFEVMENHPEWLADVPGVTMKKAAQISQSFREQTGLRGVQLFAGPFLATAQITRVYKRFGPRSVEILKENPYVLCGEVDGIPFERADAIAKSLGLPADGEERILAGLTYLLNYNSVGNGHTCLPYEKLAEGGASLLGIGRDAVCAALDAALRDGRLKERNYQSRRTVATAEADRAEGNIARRIRDLDACADTYTPGDIRALVERAEMSCAMTYARLQRRALCESLEGGVLILTGGPGTGKTTVVKAMLSIYKNLGLKCALCAPTGRAAKRLSETTSAEAKTIHRMLEMERTDSSVPKFNRNAQNPLDERVVIVDECSMMDIFLLDALLQAMRRGSRLVLIGDSSQLPSVGAGNVLADLIASGKVRTVCLTEIFRQAAESLIVTNAHRIHEGQMPVLDAVDRDFFFVCREDESAIPATVCDLIRRRLPAAYGASIRGRIQVISPSRRGTGGIEVLNNALQDVLNPQRHGAPEKLHHGVTFRVGDRVMQNTNNYDLEWEKDGEGGTGVFNGDIGTVSAVSTEDETLTVTFEDKTAVYPFSSLDELDLAYAITVHKSQGSEYPVVVIPVYHAPPMLLTRNLIYTALTRAREMVILVGSSGVIRTMVNNDREVLRYTTLCERLKEEE